MIARTLLLLVLLSGCVNGKAPQETRLAFEGWSSESVLVAWEDHALIIDTWEDSHRVRAFEPAGSWSWTRRVPCQDPFVVRDGLICRGAKTVHALSGKDGGNLWRWTAPSEIAEARFEGARLTLVLVDGQRHTVDVSNGNPVAPGPVDTGLFTSGGTLALDTDAVWIEARRYGNGRTIWTALTSLWPSHRISLHHMLFFGSSPTGRTFMALIDSETRLGLSNASAPATGPVESLRDSANGILILGKEGVLGLRRTWNDTLTRDSSQLAWALGRGTLMHVTRSGSGQELVWQRSPHRPSKSPDVSANETYLSRPGITFHGAWLRGREKLRHVEVRVRRWSPDLVYAWRTDGPWTARRVSPEASGDRGLEPAFDGAQPFSPMPLWLSPTMLSDLESDGLSRIGKLTLIKEGWSYHQLLQKGSEGKAGALTAVPVMVITRTDTGDRYWVAPNGANPMILRAERKSGRFFLATIQTDLASPGD